MSEKRDYITTYTKVHFTPLDPNPEDIRIEDIAHALSLLSRAGGHFETFHSVASHCLECATEAKARGYSKRVQLACLLHDASEAYLADVTRPVKKHMDYYREVENRLLKAIFWKYLGGLSKEEEELYLLMDNTLLYYEFYHFMEEELLDKPEILTHPDFTERPFKDVEHEYLATFYALYRDILLEAGQVEEFNRVTESSNLKDTSAKDTVSAVNKTVNKTPAGLSCLSGIKAVLFDMDGVIVDTEKLYLRFWREAAIAHGFPMTHEQALSFRSTNRIKATALFHQFFGPKASYEAIRNTRIELMNAYLMEHPAEPKPGIYELLDYLKKAGIKTAVCTMSDIQRVDLILGHNALRDRFDLIITQHMVNLGKPAPDIYLAACEKLGLNPEECLVVEDSPSGCKAGHAAECPVLMVPDADFPDEETSKVISLRMNRLDYLIPYLKEKKAL